MKLDNLLEQMMMMQQQQQQRQQQQQHQPQQQMDNEGGEWQQNVQQQKDEAQQKQQQQKQWGDMAQNNVGTAPATNGHRVQPSNKEQNFVEQSASTDNAKWQKSDAFLAISSANKNSAQYNHQQSSTVGGMGENNGRESLPQHLESFSAFLRTNLSLLSAFSPPSLPPQQNSVLPLLPTPIASQIVPLSKEIASQGLLAVGGCRPCQKTFTSRLELIHHCIDHFPNVFYSFEERPAQNNGQYSLQIPKNNVQNVTSNGGLNFQQSEVSVADSTQKIDILGQLAGIFAFNENGCSGGASESFQPFQNVQNSLLANFFKSFVPIPLQPLAPGENGTKHLAINNGTTENAKEPPRKRANASSASFSSGGLEAVGNAHFACVSASNPKHSAPCRPSPAASNAQKTTNGARKRHISHEKTAANGNGKEQAEDGTSTSSARSNKSQRKHYGSGGDGQQNGCSGAEVGDEAATRTVSASASPTAPTMPTLSELPYPMCPYCCLTFAETSAFRTHLSVHESEVTASASSSSVGASFSGPNLLMTPTDVDTANGSAEMAGPTQPQATPFKCALCETTFANAFRLTEHMRLHSAHTCNQCQKTFMTAFDLNLHMGTHTGFTYDCKDCGKCFPCRKTLAEHNRSHRMILSGGGGGSVSPELSKKAKTSNESVLGQQQQNREQSPEFGGLNGDSGSEKRRLRVAKRGEKSRRNATLVAVESAVPSPSVALPNPSSVCSAPGVSQFSNDVEEGERENS